MVLIKILPNNSKIRQLILTKHLYTTNSIDSISFYKADPKVLIASQHGYLSKPMELAYLGGRGGGGCFMFCLTGGAHIPKEHLFERKPLFEDEGWARNVFLGENKTKKHNARCMLTFLVPPSCSVQMRRKMISILATESFT